MQTVAIINKNKHSVKDSIVDTKDFYAVGLGTALDAEKNVYAVEIYLTKSSNV